MIARLVIGVLALALTPAAQAEKTTQADMLVRRGEPVQLRYHRDGITITATGKALRNAGAGETVRVFSEATRRTLDGRAIEPGVVEVDLP